MVQAIVNGPTNEEQAVAAVYNVLPDGTTLGNLEIPYSQTVKISLDIPRTFMVGNQYTERFVHELVDQFLKPLQDLQFRNFEFYVMNHDSGEYQPIRSFLPKQDLEAFKAEASKMGALREPSSPETSGTMESRSLPTQSGFVTAALLGKSVVLNQSHGWFDADSGWAKQRTRTWELLEDFSSPMFMNYYVAPLLQNAGARIRPVRELDAQTNMVVVDNAMGAPQYVESGTGWFNSALNGYVHKATFSGLADNPFGNPSSTRLVPGTTGASTASATYTPTIPVSGYYNVYISYAAGTDRTGNAHWQVYHSGGITDFRISQKNSGATWVLLGNFYFEAGAPATQAKVVALNDSGDTSYLNVDAVRFGGGMGSVARRTHGVSGRPRWQEEANNYMQYTGMLASSLMSNDNVTSDDEELGWGNRPQYANWEQTRDSLGNNLIYIGWHTNAFNWSCSGGVENNGTARGTSTYRDKNADATANTVNLTKNVHDALIASIRLSYSASWTDRGINATDGYGESNQANLGNAAGFFFEGLFHDNSADADCYKDPKWRLAAARGIQQGVISYYGGTVFPPEPVTNFRVKNIGNNQVQLNWTAGLVRTQTQPYGSAATSYRIYTSTNGYGFDNGTNTPNATTQFTATLPPGQTTFYRVSAVNSAGISIPSCTLAVRVPVNGMPTVNIVNGFFRNDKFLAPPTASSGIGGCTAPTNSYRSFDPRKINSFDYTVQHALAIAAKGGFGIDSCTRDAIKLSSVDLGVYPMVFWAAGQEGEADTTDLVDDTSLMVTERNALDAYLTNGGCLFYSGSETVWDLGRSGSPAAEIAFLSSIFKCSFNADSSNTYNATGNAGIFAGLGAVTYDNGTGSTYNVRFPDVLNTAGGSTACMSYSTGGTAAIQYAGTFGSGTSTGKVVMMGFGFETITSGATRNALMGRVIDFFTPASVADWQKF